MLIAVPAMRQIDNFKLFPFERSQLRFSDTPPVTDKIDGATPPRACRGGPLGLLELIDHVDAISAGIAERASAERIVDDVASILDVLYIQ